MKKLLILAVIALMAVSAGLAQDRGDIFGVEYRAGVAADSNDGKLITQDFRFIVGYRFNTTLSLGVVADMNTGLFETGGVKSWKANGLAGVEIGINLTRNPARPYEFLIGAGSTLSNKSDDWGYMYYDAGIKVNLGEYKHWQPYVTVGARYFDAYSSHFDNRWSIYAGFGFRFDATKPKPVKIDDPASLR